MADTPNGLTVHCVCGWSACCRRLVTLADFGEAEDFLTRRFQAHQLEAHGDAHTHEEQRS